MSWPRALAPYSEPRLGRSILDIATSVVPYVGLLVAIGFASKISVLLALALAVPAAGFQIRSFIVFHDCGHASFFRSRRANELLGAVLGLLVWLPFRCWRHEHAVHHATSGDLDRRGVGDIWTLTVDEYRARGMWGRLGYRLFRNPFVMFGLGWILVLGLKPRVFPRSATRRIRNSILLTDLALAIAVVTLVWLLGWQTFLLLQVPTMIMGAAGIWLFYVQHQFEDSVWQPGDTWSYDEAALHGSSYLKLPAILQFFTGNIGFHHVHHLSARIPNYNLQMAHEGTSTLSAIPPVTMRDGFRSVRLKLWDEQRKRLVTFREARSI